MDTLKEINGRLAVIEALLLTSKTVLTLHEVAIYTGLSKSYLYKLTHTGGIPCYKPNGKVLYFNRVEVDEWMMQNKKVTREELDQAANNYLMVKGAVR